MSKTKKAVKNQLAKEAPKEQIDVSEEALEKKRTKADIEALLKAYKDKNPVKYALKDKNGEFDKLLKSAK